LAIWKDCFLIGHQLKGELKNQQSGKKCGVAVWPKVFKVDQLTSLETTSQFESDF